MLRRDVSFTIALSGSLILHGLFMTWVSWQYSMSLAAIFLPGYRQQVTDEPVIVDQPTTAPFYVPLEFRDQLGAREGKGSAIDPSPGDDPMEALKAAQDQPMLSRDPEGPGKIHSEPSPSTAIPGDGGAGGTGQRAPRFGVAPQASVATAQPKLPVQKREPLEPRPDTPGDLHPATQPVVVQVPDAAAVTPKSSDAGESSSAPGSPGAPVAPADPFPQADTESDPFTSRGSVAIRRGRMDVQFGRKHRLTYPRLGLSGETALLKIPGTARVVLKLNISKTGTVTRAEVFKSSGSKDIDQPCKVAAYEWWLEPTLDAQGNPIDDVILFTIAFR